MAEFPALPMWTDAFLADTMQLNAAETGAYLLLLMTAWRRPDNDLPDDDLQLQRFARCSPREWKKIKPKVMCYFLLISGSWRNQKLDRVRVEVRNLSAKRRSAALARWRKPLKHQGRGDADGDDLQIRRSSNQNQNQNQKSLTKGWTDE
jgi:uncharacterized protein YdaU (DUF1376 family)